MNSRKLNLERLQDRVLFAVDMFGFEGAEEAFPEHNDTIEGFADFSVDATDDGLLNGYTDGNIDWAGGVIMLDGVDNDPL